MSSFMVSRYPPSISPLDKVDNWDIECGRLVLDSWPIRGAYDRSLARAARAAMVDVVGVKKGERVLIITNPTKATERSRCLSLT